MHEIIRELAYSNGEKSAGVDDWRLIRLIIEDKLELELKNKTIVKRRGVARLEGSNLRDDDAERRVPCKVRDSFAAKVEGEPEVLWRRVTCLGFCSRARLAWLSRLVHAGGQRGENTRWARTTGGMHTRLSFNPMYQFYIYILS